MRRMIATTTHQAANTRRGFAVCSLRELSVLATLIAVMTFGFDRVQHGLQHARPHENDALSTVHKLVIDETTQELWAVCHGTGMARYSLPALKERDFVPIVCALMDAAFTAGPSSGVFACISEDGAVEIHVDGRKVAELPEVPIDRRIGCQPHGSVGISHDGNVILAGTMDGKLHRWRRRNGELLYDAQIPGGPLERIELHRNGQLAAIVTERTRLGIWNLERGAWEREWDIEHDFCTGLAWSPDGRRLASIGTDAQVCVWDAQRGTLLWEQTGDLLDPAGAAFSPCGRWLVTGGFDNRVRIWDASNGSLAAEHSGHTRPARSFAWSADSRNVYSSGLDGRVRAWDAPAGTP